MSLLNDASLILVPSAIKTGEVLVQKPLPNKFADETGNYDGNDPQGSANLTFTRASNATRVNADGLVERVRTNLILQSNTFDTTWVNNNTTETGGQSDKDGGSTAWLIDSSSAFGSINQAFSAVSGVFTFSVYAKAGTNNWILLRMLGSTSARAWFNLSSGVLGSTDGPTIQSKIEAVGGGYYRCSISADMTSFGQVLIYPTNADTVVGAAGSIYIQNAQLEYGDIATDYLETTTSARSTFAGITVDGTSVPNVPRLDYSGGASCPSALLEPQRTNALLWSESFDNAAWSKSSGITVTANAAISPDGYQNADKLIPPVGTSNSFYIIQAAAGTCMSVFAKAAGKSKMLIYSGVSNSNVWFDLTSGQVTTAYSDVASASVEDYGGGWFRFSVVWNTTSTNIRIYAADNDNSFSVTGNGTDGILIWGAMLEQGSYSTSLISTQGSAVTRLADAAYKTGISSLIGQTEGTMFLEAKALNETPSANAYTSISNSTGSNRIIVGLLASANSLRIVGVFGGVSNGGFNYTIADTTTYFKVLVKYYGSTLDVFINGVKQTSQTFGGFSNAVDAFRFDDGNGTLFFEGNVKQRLLFPTALTDQQCIELTTL